ncbi:isochorismatase family protein [Rhodanobacter sp. C01]|uniref:isochorismatase family protein n=1 Tax=Rhodanobacter sp. C01 TaxID=1945856 RepID=UPI001C2CA727|nr:isochorismatase family protein [Rhodanobacter sp. C01]
MPGMARPIVVTTTARDSMWGPTFPELVEELPDIQIIDRSSVNAWDNHRVAAAVEATGRKKLIFAGISLEVCAALACPLETMAILLAASRHRRQMT